ncbi:MAG: ABC transporter permease subunit, partial [Firmicutes bacterium]|nr:ABC transporter permease subunit [Bacillota bacterium]
LCAVGILSKEEKDKTAEFLLTHPVSRVRIITEKLIAVVIQITAMNVMIYALAVGSIAAVGEEIPWKEISLLHLAYYLLQLELAGICFGLSAFLRKGGAGVGLGIATMMYFLNLIANIAEVAEFLKYITPFGYCEGADIVLNGKLDASRVAIGAVIGIGGIILAYLKYTRKDIQ